MRDAARHIKTCTALSCERCYSPEPGAKTDPRRGEDAIQRIQTVDVAKDAIQRIQTVDTVKDAIQGS